MNYIVTRPLKNKGLAIFLAFFPFGLFYSSVYGGLIMYFILPVLTLLCLIYSHSELSIYLFLLLTPFHVLICIVWAAIAVSDYNRAILKNSLSNYPVTHPHEIELTLNDDIGNKKDEIYKNLETIKGLYDKNVIDETEFNKQRESLLRSLEILTHNESSIQPLISSNYVNEPKRKSNVLIWILSVALLLSLVVVCYQKGIIPNTLFDKHSKDEADIKDKIEELIEEFLMELVGWNGHLMELFMGHHFIIRIRVVKELVK